MIMYRTCLWTVALLVFGGLLTGCKSKKSLAENSQEEVLLQTETAEALPPTNAQHVYNPDGGTANDDVITADITRMGSTVVRKILYLPEETDTKPQFPGGDAAYKKFLARNVKYPQAALKKKLQGSVKIGFTVNPDGSIVNAKVERKVNALLDNEALRVVKSMPRWIPGLYQGKPVPVKMSIPVNFRLSVKKK